MKTAFERLFGRVERIPFSGCWIWMGCVHYKGYGEIYIAYGRKTKTHRLAWELSRGTIPNGLFVLHRCDVPACINPDHLWLGTNKDNMIDAGAKGRLSVNSPHRLKTHCPHGHAYDVVNTYVDRKGHRHCKTCQYVRQHRDRYIADLESAETKELIEA